MKNSNSTKDYYREMKERISLPEILIISVAIAAIVLIVDRLNILCKNVSRIPSEILIIVVVSVVILTVIFMHIYNAHKMFISNIVNGFERFFLISEIVGIILAITWLLLEGCNSYKTLISFIYFVLILIAWIVKCLLYKYNKGRLTDNKKTNYYDLKEIFDNDFEITPNIPFLLAENSVNYDLLNREALCSSICDTIFNYNSEYSFAIGLRGEWGSGKTTLINGVKRQIDSTNENEQNKVIVIDNFEPWTFGNQEALLIAMYETILKILNLEKSSMGNQKTIKKLSKAVANNYRWGGVIVDFVNNNNEIDIRRIRDEIKVYLKNNNKKLVFIIDNLDRLSEDNILFLLKLVSVVFNLPHMVYIIAYDGNRLDRIFKSTGEMNSKYIEKVIQQEINMPIITREQKLTIFGGCLRNIINKYKIDEKHKELFLENVNDYSRKFSNIREFKRFINGSLNFVLFRSDYLDINYLMEMEMIKFYEPLLYNEINSNRRFFISQDTNAEREMFMLSINVDEFNAEGKKFYDRLFEEYSEYKETIIKLFPYAKRYDKTSYLVKGRGADSYDDNSETPICSAKCFDEYFSYANNIYIEIKSDVKKFISKLINNKESEILKQKICEDLKKQPEGYQKEWLFCFDSMISDIPYDIRNELAKVFFDEIYCFDDSLQFLVLSARNRVEVIICDLVKEMSEEVFDDFVNHIKNAFDKCLVIDQVIYWLEKAGKDQIKQRLEKEHSEMAKIIENNDIDLYRDENYHYRNIWGYYRSFKTKGEKHSHLKSYISKIVSKKNIIRVLGDAVSASTSGSTDSYHLDEKTINAMFDNLDTIDEFLKSVEPRNKTEEQIVSIYEKYKTNEKDEFGKYGITVSEPIDFDML